MCMPIVPCAKDALTSTTNGKRVNVRGGADWFEAHLSPGRSRYHDLQHGHPINQEAAARLQLPSLDECLALSAVLRWVTHGDPRFLRLAQTSMGCSDLEMQLGGHGVAAAM